MTYPNPISSPYAEFKPMKQPKTLKEIKQERRAIIENAWFNQEISDEILERFYEEEYEDIYLDIVIQSDVTESGKDWEPTEEDREKMHKLASKRARKSFEELP